MSNRSILCALALLLVWANGNAVELTAPPIHGEMVIATPDAENLSKTLSCEFKLVAEHLVITGGLSAQSVLPVEASKALELRTRNIKAYLAAVKGQFVELDRLRAARNPKATDADKALPFMQLQRFEVLLPVGSNIDAILEQLFKLGMDRYGENVGIEDYRAEQFALLTQYRFVRVTDHLQELIHNCRTQALAKMCGSAKCGVPAHAWGELSGRYLTRQGWRELRYGTQKGELSGERLREIDSTSAADIKLSYRETLNFPP